MSRKNEEPQVPQSYASRTDVGNVREHNEDSFIAQSPLFVVADGMGGHQAGEVASEIAIQTMAANVPEGPDAEALAYSVILANEAVLRGAQDGTGKPGMGTTVTAAVVFGNEVVIAQVGDSRAYLMHNGALQRITRDHSLVADLVAQGRLTEEEARVHPQRSVITRALGSDPHMQPDTYRLNVEEGDRLLLCSDGLSSMLDDESIESIMALNPDPRRACDALVDEALAAGGLDNVTVIVIDPLGVEGEEEQVVAEKKKGRKKRAKKRRGWVAPVLGIIAFVLIVAAACGGFYYYTQNSYYLISEDDDVVLYQGLPGEFLGYSFSWEQERVEIDTSLLAPTVADRLAGGISLDSREEGEDLIATYQETVAEAEAAEAAAQAEEEAAAQEEEEVSEEETSESEEDSNSDSSEKSEKSSSEKKSSKR